MWILAALCVGAIALWHTNRRRGRRFVRAVHFLCHLDAGCGADEANGRVARLFSAESTPAADAAAVERALERADRLTGGKQLPWIDVARRRGFSIDSGDPRFDLAHLSRAQPRGNTRADVSEQWPLEVSEEAQSPDDALPRARSSASGTAPREGPERRARKAAPVRALEPVLFAGTRWAMRGGLCGLGVGVIAPRVGVLADLAMWAAPIAIAWGFRFGGTGARSWRRRTSSVHFRRPDRSSLI